MSPGANPPNVKHAENTSAGTGKTLSESPAIAEEDPGTMENDPKLDTEDNLDVEPVRKEPSMETKKDSEQAGVLLPVCIRNVLPFTTQNIMDDDQSHSPHINFHKRYSTNLFLTQCAAYRDLGIVPSDRQQKQNLVQSRYWRSDSLWITGHLTRVQFIYDNALAKLASISIALLSKELSRQIANMMAKLCKPTQATISKGWAELRAIKWQSTKNGDGGSSEPRLFDAVFDAWKRLQPKNKMKFYSPLDLKKRDLVLVEAHLTRYNVKEENKWNPRTQLEFHVISILHNTINDACDGDRKEDDLDVPDLNI
ncbi:hypothetical protein BJ138DRAFT_1119428 [Hygrophoropsis aurantiaca]|uniref:Uncharacterized protein n=1 Tax=Hygrophoropsis aurantiaca TaxID=72124 RepID=A0ACB7ZVQ5_9AGAM|nr:hypothetical protein BJ138DRAFT_1119428 [Hygrophoropsis aurantiaca]